jgi:hypothetical protein
VLGVAIAGAAATLAIAFTLRAVLRQRRLAVPDVVTIEKRLRSGTEADARAAIRSAFADAAPAMLDAMTDKRVSSLNAAASALDERLGDLDRQLSAHGGIAGSSVRIALLSAALGAILELARNLGAVTSALSAALLGVGAAATCFELGRNTARRAAVLRRDWDRVAAAAVKRLGLVAAHDVGGSTAADEPEAPGRRRSQDTFQNTYQRRRRRRGSE